MYNLIEYSDNYSKLFILTWSANCAISNADNDQNTTFAITDTKLYVPIVFFSTLQNYCNDENLDKNAQLIGTSIIQKQKYSMLQTIFRFLN